MQITSRENKRFKLWKKLKTKKERDRQGLFLIEGEHLVEEAFASNWVMVDLMVREGDVRTAGLKQVASERNVNFYVLPPALFDEVASTETPQGVLAVLKKPSLSLFDQKAASLLLMVDEVRDPGNLGTLIRTADAAGVDAVLIGKGTTDPYGEKALRSTQGSLFHLPVFQMDLVTMADQLKAEGWLVVGATLQGMDLRKLSIQRGQKVALIVGNEARGISAALEQTAPYHVKIPLFGQAESLNVGVAAGILLYHIQFQRKGSNME